MGDVAPATLRGAFGSLVSPVTVGQGPGAPRVRPWPFLIVVALLALQAWARYRWGFFPEKESLWIHIGLGWAAVTLVLVGFHGRGFLRQISWRVVFTLAMTLVGLLTFWYLGRSDSFRLFFDDPEAPTGTFMAAAPFMFFAANATFWRIAVPFGAAWVFLKLPPARLGLPVSRVVAADGLPILARRLVPWIYLVLFLGVLPFVVAVSSDSAFLAKYPLSRAMVDPDGAMWLSHFIGYEAIYFFVFLSGESFWRGFISFGLERDLGLYGLLFMLVPYVTSHFGKPLPETLGAIAAGLVLGFLALKHRSVWLGVALHYGIALTMDVLAVMHHGYTLK